MRTLTGIVVSVKMGKTIVVEISRQIVHPLYKKIMHRTTRLKAHNEIADIKEGDKVQIVSARPISKEKHFKVLKVEK